MIKKITRPLLTFIIAFGILIVPFAFAGLYPFGDRQIMIIDSWHQYYPILQQLQSKLLNGDSLFYTWQSGGGTNFWLMMTYYAMSPLNLLSVLVPKINLREFMAFMTLFKIALGGTAFTVYLQLMHKRYDLSTTIFGLLYAFCGFFMSYYWNIMWLDVVAIFPLVILGLHRVVFQKKYALYVLTLAYAVFSNYYMAYFVCFFIAIYAFIVIFIEAELSSKAALKRLLMVVLLSLLAVGIAAVVIVPVFEGMKLAYGLSSADPKKMKTYTTLFDTLNRFMPFIKPSVVDGLPNLTLGSLGSLFFILFFVQDTHKLKAKIAYGSLFAFLIFSTNINYLNFIWHGLHFPNQVPFRFAFLISFLMLSVAYKAYLDFDKTDLKTYFKVIAGVVLYIIFAEKLMAEAAFSKFLYAIILLIAIYSALLLLQLKSVLDKRVVAQILLLVMIAESTAMMGITVDAAGSSNRSHYFARGEEVAQLLTYLRDEDNAIQRVEMSPIYSANDPLLYQYRGISQFSSTANAKYTTFTKTLGLSSNEPSNSYKYIPNTPIANGFLGINYIISKDEKLPSNNAAYSVAHQAGSTKLLRSNFAMPFAFGVKQQIYQKIAGLNSPFERQQKLANKASGLIVPLFDTIYETESVLDNINSKERDGVRYRYRNTDATRKGRVKLIFNIEREEQVYIYLKNQNKTAKLEYDGMMFDFDPRRGVVMDLGILDPQTRVSISFEVNAQASGYYDLHAVAFNAEAYQRIYRQLTAAPLQIETFEDTYIAGFVDMPEAGTLYTSIPFDGGWQATVDYRPLEIVPLHDAVMSLPLAAGKHHIELRYTPPGLKRGALISLLSLLTFVILLAYSSLLAKKNRLLLALSGAVGGELNDATGDELSGAVEAAATLPEEAVAVPQVSLDVETESSRAETGADAAKVEPKEVDDETDNQTP